SCSCFTFLFLSSIIISALSLHDALPIYNASDDFFFIELFALTHVACEQLISGFIHYFLLTAALIKLVLVETKVVLLTVTVVFVRSEEHTSELQSRFDIVSRFLIVIKYK